MSIDPREQAALDLKVARADAIHKYAAVEQCLCTLFSGLLKTDMESGAIVFFQIIAARSRLKIIEDLLEKNFQEIYSAYWHGIPGSQGVRKQPGLIALIQQLDTTRNFIVHWGVAVNLGEGPAFESLVPQNFWRKGETRSLTVSDIEEFSKKADFVFRSINMFHLATLNGTDFPTRGAWLDIFQQPCVYPPADNHPLARKQPAQQNPPQPSGA